MTGDTEEISETAPGYSLAKVFGTIRQKGIVRALDDPEQGPHVHLTLLLVTVAIVSILIILITTFVM